MNNIFLCDELLGEFPTINNKVLNFLEREVNCFREYIDSQNVLIVKQWTSKEIAEYMEYDISTFFRRIKQFKKYGVKGLVSKKYNTRCATKFTEDQVSTIINLYNGHTAQVEDNPELDFSEYSFEYFHAHVDAELFPISYSKLRTILINAGFKSSHERITKSQCGRIAAELNKKYAVGERLEIDATAYVLPWNDEKIYFHVAYDRGLKAPVAIYIAPQETTVAYFKLLRLVNNKFGIPINLITDKRGTFVCLLNQDGSKTYFSKCFEGLNCKITSSSNSNIKPGVEGFNKTLKTRLSCDIKRLNINDVDELQKYLTDIFVPNTIKFSSNKQKRKKGHVEPKNVFRKQLTEQQMENKFVIEKRQRTISNYGTLKINGVQYNTMVDGKVLKYKKGTKIYEVTNFNGEVTYRYGQVKLTLKESILAKYECAIDVKITKRNIRRKDNIISYKSQEFVPVYNNGKIVKVELDKEYEVIDKEGKLSFKYNSKSYNMILKSEFENIEFLVPPRAYKPTYRSTIYFGNVEHVIVDSSNTHIELAIATEVLYNPVVNLKHEFFIDGIAYSVLPVSQYEKKDTLPRSKYLHN